MWDEYARIIAKYDDRGAKAMGSDERFEFYRQARTCCCTVQSGETSAYANLILQKGIIK